MEAGSSEEEHKYESKVLKEEESAYVPLKPWMDICAAVQTY